MGEQAMIPVSETDTQTGIAPASSGRGSRDAPVGDPPNTRDALFYVYKQCGEASCMADAEGIARELADWDRIEIRSACGETVAVLDRGKWFSTMSGIKPTYTGGRRA